MSADMDEFAKQVSEEIERESCEKEVPIYPVRYTIKESREADMVDELSTTYPNLKWSNYTLRTVRLGFVYLFDETKGEEGLRVWKTLKDGTFQELKIKSKKSIKDLASTIYGLKPDLQTYMKDSTSYILAPAKSTKVHVGFSDALWTPYLTQQIIDNEQGIRDKLMVKINVKTWEEDTPLSDTFNMNTMGTLVEEYKDEAWRGNGFLPKAETAPFFKNYKNLCSVMSAVPTCEKKIIGVKLYDNIGLVKDLRLLIGKFQKSHSKFMNDENVLHKKMVSNFIEFTYKQEVSKNKKKPFEAVYEEGLWEDIPVLNVDNHATQPKSRKFGVDEQKYKESFFKKNAPDKVQLINEEARQGFLEYYANESKRLSQKVIEVKNDRAIHVAQLFKSDMNIHLGASFLNYDRSYDLETESCGNSDESSIVSTYSFSQSLASCIDGMMSEVSKLGVTPNRDAEQFDLLFKEEEKSNLLYEVFMWASESKLDSLSALLGATTLTTFKTEKENQEAIDKATEKRSQEIQKKRELKNKIEKRQKNIAQLERKLALEKEAVKEASEKSLHRELSQVEKEKRIKHRINEVSLEVKLNQEKAKLAKLNEESLALEAEKNKLKAEEGKLNKEQSKLKDESYDNRRNQKELTDDLKTKRIILHEKNLELNAYSQQVVQENISLYLLNRKDIAGAALNATANKLGRILQNKSNNINVLLPQFDEWNWNRERKHKKRVVERLEVSYDLYMDLFYTTEENHTKIDNKRLHVKNQLLDKNKKVAFFVMVDDETLLRLQQYIPILEKEILEIKSKLGKHNSQATKTARDIEETSTKIGQNTREQALNRESGKEKKRATNDITRAMEGHNKNSSLSAKEIEEQAASVKDDIRGKVAGHQNSDLNSLDEAFNSKVKESNEKINQHERDRKTASSEIALAKKELAQTFQYWVMGVSVSTNAAISLLNIVNLKMAYDGVAKVHAINSDSTNKEVLASWTNFMGAIMGTISAVYGTSLGVKQATKIVINPSSQLRRSAGAIVVRGILLEAAEKKATLFGILAGVADAITASVNAWIQFTDENNSESGTLYLIGGFLLTMSVGVPLVGVFVGSIFLTGIGGIIISLGLIVVGLVALFWAEEAKWKAIDKWLSGCFFRSLNDDDLAEGKGLVVYHPNVMYAIKTTIDKDDIQDQYNTHTLSDNKQKAEILGFYEALSEPKIEIAWESNFLKQDIGEITNDLMDMVSGYPLENKIASIKIRVKFPLLLEASSFRYGINTSTAQKPSLHEISMSGGINHYRWTTAEFTGSELKLDIRHLSNRLSRMNLGLSFQLAFGGEVRILKLYYKINRDESYQRIK